MQSEESNIFSLDDMEGVCSTAADQPSVEYTYSAKEDGPSSSESVIDPFRRTMLQLEPDEDICSICLDAFSDEDPGNITVCRHTFHLQCIMQWAQRSRECPLCFQPLAMQDSDLQALLPFGEYVPPEHSSAATSALLGVEPWDMEKLLQRLALQKSSGAGRRSRHRGRVRPFSMAGGKGPEQIEDGQADARRGVAELCETTTSQFAESEFPSSWPPSGAVASQDRRSSVEAESGPTGSGTAADLRGTGESLKSRWSSFQSRWRDSLSRSTSGFRSNKSGGQPTSPSALPRRDQ